ncbi:hypothetical protein M407DRAFT_23791 [Tulasnella calospora MUT 4182]|uniref:Ankyrin repeat protein n=1 Tax=Tulasnella calospora MUT 4182 TaxID=1051891 RepID=A0A0C3QJ07_9AGAM|nr:hypothetical protein M407DRAFT_23791 [Tulasnella calospora MUT 4182]
MAQTAEAQAFLRRLGELPVTPGVDLGPAITPSLQDEEELRRLFATDRENARLKDPYVGLVDVFGENTERIKKAHARTVQDEDDLRKHYVMPLDDEARRKDGELSMAPSLDEFKTRWAIFSEGALSQLTNWDNVVAAGGSVLACLAPLPEHVVKQGSKRALRKYYHSEAYPASDVDLFLYGLTPEQAEEKCIEIYNAVRDSVPWEVCAIRTKNAVSIHCQYPYRPVQIILRIYQSPAEILAGFDVDSTCVAFDGTRVLAAPRAVSALMTQRNRVAMDRRSPSYEVRLAKYAARGFEIHVPDLRREDFDPTIFERALTRVAGLARLLVLEKLATQEARDGFLNLRRRMRGRPNSSRRQMRRDARLKGDLKSAAEFGGLQMSEYDVMFHIPYGPGINAKRVCKIVYQTDLGMNRYGLRCRRLSPVFTFNPKNKGRRLHRHPAFFGNIKEALEDCCEYCPSPETDEEKEMFETEQEQCITGRISFLQENPGRQSITGSFHPIDSGEWSEQAYLKPLAKLFSYIASHSRSACNDFLKRNADAINTRDHLGRNPLQFALLCSAEEICLDLIEQGGRMTSRMVDGRCSLHLAAQLGLPRVVKALLEKNEKNKAEKEAKEKEAKENERKDKGVKMKDKDDEIRDSSEDDWSSENDEDRDYEEAKKKVDAKGDLKGEEDGLEDSEDGPDILDIDAPDWDQSLTALGYAIISGSLPIVQILIAAGADCKTPKNISDNPYSTSTFYPLALTMLTPDESVGAQIAEHLITAGGASCSAADSDTVTVFHRLVSRNKPQIVETLLRVDSTAKAASRFLYARTWNSAVHPIVSAFSGGQRAMVAVLLAYAGSRVFIDLETYDRSVAANPNPRGYSYARAGEEQWKQCTLQPLEAALVDHSDLYRLVLELEPESLKNSVPKSVYQYQGQHSLRRSMLDFLRSAIREMKRRSREPAAQDTSSSNNISTWRNIFDLSDMEISEKKGWDAHAIAWEKRKKKIFEANAKANNPNATDNIAKAEEEKRAQAAKLIPYFQQAVEELEKASARTWDEIYKDMPSEWKKEYGEQDFDPDDPNAPAHTSNQSSMSGQSRTRKRATKAPGASQSESTDETIEETAKPFKRYSLFVSGWGEDYPGTHLIPLYDELYEACWNGDNDKIRALCLPPKDDSAPPPSGTRDLLQITARVKYTNHTNNYSKGYTPLYVALRARKWDTARLILEIAEKQLMKEEADKELKTANRGGTIIRFDDDDDDDEDSDANSCASDETEKRPAGYTDLAKRFHTVSVKIKPNQLLSYDAQCAIEGTSGANGYTGTADPITVATWENDVEAFAQIADMMANLKEPISIPERLRDTILTNDSPDLLDAYIRRTGDGLTLPKPKAKESADTKVQAHQHDDDDDDEYKIYLGLNVHGKKRKDLVRKEDPNAPSESDDASKVPMVWRAASYQAIAVLEYLNGPKVIEAYKYYAETYKTKLAKRLAEALQNPEDFPKMVGFSVSRLAETPVLAAVWNPAKPDLILPTLKKLMQMHPRLTADGVRLQVRPNRMSAFNLLCCTKAPVEAFDWMLANGADPLVRNESGWNILHSMFFSYDPNRTLTEHALAKLPADVIETLMVQQTHTHRNTPFAIAVKKGNLRLVELLLRTVKSAIIPTLLIRDSTGATPLHAAILKGYSKIISHLISIGPPEMLYLENGVGSTPLEITRLGFLTQTLRGLANSLNQPEGFNVYGVNYLSLTPAPGMRNRDEQEVKSLRRVIEGIKTSGALAKKPELLEVLSTFADRSEQEFATWLAQKPKEEAHSTPAYTNNGYDLCNVPATFDVLSKAVVEIHQRQLVHLSDVQRAVLTAVESQTSGSLRQRWATKVQVEGLEEEEPDQKQDVDYSAILGSPGKDWEATS